MGKTKGEKKFDRNIEISRPILDPEIIRQIHSPPKNQRRDIRHGGFKALLSDLNSQDSTDELTPITENHLPSYIGISCAVSGYSNYSSYGRKPLDEPVTRTDTKTHKIATTSAAANNRSQTNSPLAVRTEQHNIHHVTIDKSNIDSAESERKELTEKLTASAAERRLSPSPIPPTEDDRHHGAYVGARYFPMPEPSKVVNKHIPLLGIDDDIDPDDMVEVDENKVEKKIASLYGEEFVEDWKASMSNKSKKELADERQAAEAASAPKKPKDIVNLKPTPPKTLQPEQPIQVDIPTPNVKVLAGVEREFLNKLLTDENPPMPKSPPPQPMSPISPKQYSPVRNIESQPRSSIGSGEHTPFKAPTSTPPAQDEPLLQYSPVSSPDLVREEAVASPARSGSELVSGEVGRNTPQAHESPIHDLPASPVNHSSPSEHLNGQEQLISLGEPATIVPELEIEKAQPEYLIDVHQESSGALGGQSQVDLMSGPEAYDGHTHDAQPLEGLSGYSADPEIQAVTTSDEQLRSRSPSEGSQRQAESPESQISTSTVERVVVESKHFPDDADTSPTPQESELEVVVKSTAPPLDNQSSPIRRPEVFDEDSQLTTTGDVDIMQCSDKLVSLSPEPVAEANNNLAKQIDDHQDVKQHEEVLAGDEPVREEQEASENETNTSVAAQSDNNEREDKVDEGSRGLGHHFLDLLKEEESFIMERVRLAEQLLAEHGAEMDEERLGRIHSAIGKANLLINKKCNQFRELCEKSINGDVNDQYAVLDDDLAGFWDMISIQITDVRKSLQNP